MIVTCIVCEKCKDLIYSRARHDFMECSCKSISIDGGREYTKISYEPNTTISQIESLQLSSELTEFNLVEDWSKEKPQKGLFGIYGRLKQNEYMWSSQLELYMPLRK